MGKQSREKQEVRQNKETKFLPEKNSTLTNVLKKIIFIGTGFVLFTPFIVSGKYFFPFVGPKSIYFFGLVEIIFAVWLILIFIAPKYRPKLNILTIALIVFIISAILSTFLGADPARSFWSKYERMTGLLMYFHLFAFFLTTSSIFRKKEEWLKIFGVSVFASILMGALTLFNLIGVNLLGNLAEATRGGATIGNSSFLGTYLLFNFFLALYLIFNSRNLFKVFSVTGLVIIGAALIFSTARAALLSTIGGLVLLFLLWLILSGKKNFKLYGTILVIILLIGIILSVFLATKPGNFVNDAVKQQIGNTFGGRLIVWEGAWKGFLDRPMFGWGPENFDYVFTKHFNSCMLGPDCGGDIWYDRAHNVVFDTLVMTGLVGLLSYLGLFLASFYVLWRQFWNQNINFWTAGIFTVVLMAYFIQNLTVFDMVNSYMMFFLMLSFISVLEKKEGNKISERKPNLLVIVAVLIIFIISFFKFVIDPLSADRNIIVSFSIPHTSQERLNFYTKTLDISPVGRFQIVDFFTQNDLEFLQNQSSEISNESAKKILNFDAQELEKVIQESPLDYRSHLRLGQLYNAYAVINNTSKFSNAEEVLNKAIELSPTNQQGYWALAQTRVYEGRLEDALFLTEEALSLEPKSRNGNFIVIQIAKLMGDENLVQEKARKAVEADSSLKEDIETVFGITL
ncbi:O-antigen ligase family protein [Patescibacteria group bacterium]